MKRNTKRSFILAGILLLSFPILAEAAGEKPMSLHRDNYFILGTEDLKFQISAKYNLLNPIDIGLYFSYSGLAFWDIYGESSPFREYNHNPEVFLRVEENRNIFGNSPLGIADFIRIAPYDHKSNGRDGPLSRGMDRYYGEFQLSVGGNNNFGIRIKAWGYYSISNENRDIREYLGYGEGEIFFRQRDSDLKIYVKGGPGTDLSKGWIEAGLMIRPFNTVIKPYLLLQFYHGYGEALVGYNRKDTMFRAGIVFR